MLVWELEYPWCCTRGPRCPSLTVWGSAPCVRGPSLLKTSVHDLGFVMPQRCRCDGKVTKPQSPKERAPAGRWPGRGGEVLRPLASPAPPEVSIGEAVGEHYRVPFCRVPRVLIPGGGVPGRVPRGGVPSSGVPRGGVPSRGPVPRGRRELSNTRKCCDGRRQRRTFVRISWVVQRCGCRHVDDPGSAPRALQRSSRFDERCLYLVGRPLGMRLRKRAAAPETIGAAIEVPERRRYLEFTMRSL